MRRRLIALCVSLLCAATAAPTNAAVSVSIGINVPVYPQMVVVPGYPVYYAPAVGANFFFYDGMYWVLDGDDWYMSSWYNGPWALVEPAYVPYYVLRVPVRYYMAPPPYFRGWQPGAPPRWGSHWGPQWEQRHHDWDRWDRRATPAPAPLPNYQRRYSGDRYPSPGQQTDLQTRNYRYQPRAEAARQFVPPQSVEHRGPAVVQQRPQMEQPPQHPQEPRRDAGGPPWREAGPRMPPQQGRAEPQQGRAEPQQGRAEPQQGRAEPQERGRGHGEEGRDRRDNEGRPPPGR
ncbi:hypothetical protein [Roseateles sp.]|uniref:hypothetical protein n=1 Tax=Roseateles sp. TaxID=1971397 RepID=UPI0025D39410|nr:hypothetical protein [Roseateles sp.]MBV8035579.1 hypothetical protein [Roseateles sp.]